MQIGAPRIERNGEHCVLSAPVEVEARDAPLPGEVRFALAGSDPSVLSASGDAFLVALLPVAMRLGEQVSISGAISARLAHGLIAYQEILATWFPSLFRPVPVHYEKLGSRGDERRPEGVGCTFSGGVDSFHTLWRGTPPRQAIPGYRLTHALMINGFDQIVDETGEGCSREMERVYRPVLAEAGVELVMLTSNMKQFRDAVFPRGVRVLSFGSPLVAGAHALGRLFGRFTLAGHATHAYADLVPMGSHPALDHHLGTDRLQVIHDAAPATRWQRIARLAEMPAFRTTLRVCTKEPRFDEATGAVVNCCDCEKCIRTMITLDLLDLMDEFPTFPDGRALDRHKAPEKIAGHSVMFLVDNFRLARERGRSDWAGVLEQAIRIQQDAARRRSNRS